MCPDQPISAEVSSLGGGRHTVWAADEGITWDNATNEIRERFALVRLFWFYRMVASGGPDGSELDAEVAEEARVAAEWLSPILMKRAGMDGDNDF